MSDLSPDAAINVSNQDSEHQATNPFIEFKKEDIDQSIADRFEQQVRRYPYHLAAKTKFQKFTYDELNRRANRVAHSILTQKGRSQGPIALLCEQGISMIIGSLGVLKTGKAFVPVDYSLPREKTIRILHDIEASIILSDDANYSLARSLACDSLMVLNVSNLAIDLSDENPGRSVSSDDVIYIHFTSGSTGEPKGVVWSHRNELYGTMLKTNALRISPDDRISLLRSNNVGATRDAFLALLNGAALLPLELKKEGLTNLANWLIDEEITVYTCVATVFRHTVRSLTGNEKFPKIRVIHIGGEPIFKSDVELYKKHFSDECIFVSRFGISETPTVSYYFINKQTDIEGERVPVGYPLEGNEIRILDDNGREMGVNGVGEIAVKSSYLALGYWKRPELTSAKFLPDPEGGPARIYRTGDLGYMMPDGCLVHMGRKDFQAKIRGYRVEVSEIEMALLDLGYIKQTAVIAREDTPNSKCLVAYVVPQEGQTLTISQLGRVLKEKLPSYMLPSFYVILDSLPLTVSGKIDRRALPPPPRSRPELDRACLAPRTSVEEMLAWTWSSVLEIDEVGVEDDFFELGGNSLLAAQIVSRVNDTFPLKCPLKILFETPTVAKLADFIIANETHPMQSEKIANILINIESMSPEDIRSALEEETRTKGNA